MFLGLFLILLELAFIALLIFVVIYVIGYIVAVLAGGTLLGVHSLMKKNKEQEKPERKCSNNLTIKNVAVYCVNKQHVSTAEVSKYFNIKYNEAKRLMDLLAQYKILKDNGPLKPYEALINKISDRTPLPDLDNNDEPITPAMKLFYFPLRNGMSYLLKAHNFSLESAIEVGLLFADLHNTTLEDAFEIEESDLEYTKYTYWDETTPEIEAQFNSIWERHGGYLLATEWLREQAEQRERYL